MKTTYNKFISIIILVASITCAHQSLAQQHRHDDSHNHSESLTTTSNQPKPASNAPCEQLVKAHVNGLVCDFCARALEKVFGKKQEVAGIVVNLDEGYVLIEFNAGHSIAETELNKMIVDSGYNVVSINSGCEL